MPTALLEIGTEELPAGFLPPALAQLNELARARLQAERIDFGSLHSWGTPRRIVLYVTGIADHQAPVMREVRGPAVSAAFASNGEPTQAAIGFARSQRLTVNDLRIRQVDGGEYVVAVFHDEGRPAFEMLSAIFFDLVTGLSFPKTMRWGAGSFRFARPIRWIVAMCDDAVIPLAVDGVTAGSTTRGHRFLARGEVQIRTAAEYPRLMDENQVIVDPDMRREVIRQQLEATAEAENAVILDDGALLEATTFRVEYPTAVRGAIDPACLSLPDVVLLRVLTREQDFFPLGDRDGALLPAFIGVRNGDKAYLSTVREGYEAVVRAKLLDARFFFDRDRAVMPLERLDALREVVFHERLGSMYDKTKRVETLARSIATLLHLDSEESDLAARAALLAKTDLVSAMVLEYPELQGAMGRIYAEMAGEPSQVASAIGEQYQPRAAGDAIPATVLGKVLALADRLDTVVGCVALGLMPTGSEDPLAVCRAALGLVRILAGVNDRLPLATLVDSALALLPAAAVGTGSAGNEAREAVLAFLYRRVEHLLAADGISAPIITAVLPEYADIPSSALAVARVLMAHLEDPDFHLLARAAARLGNIARQSSGGEIEPALLRDPAERDLFARFLDVAPKAGEVDALGDLNGLLELLKGLVPAVDRFFSEVLVMAEDPVLRRNRLALVWHLAALFRPFGDLSSLPSV